MSKKVVFTINLNGNAISGVAALTDKVNGLSAASERAQSLFAKIGNVGLRLHGIISTVSSLTGMVREFTEANKAQQEAETKLAQVMRNTMGASDAEIASIKELASAQQKLGVIGDEVQLAGAQELGTYLSKADSLKKLMPVMNDMLAQQYGLNASQEQATQIASMMGKVMDGQVGALSRYGYKFDEAQEKLLKYGTEEQRVATLAEVISQSVGGMNEAMAATPEGKLKQAANRVGDIKETIGQLIQKLEIALLPILDAAMPVVERLLDKLGEVVNWISSNVIQPLIGIIKPLWDEFSAFIMRLKEAVMPFFTSVIENLSKVGELFTYFFQVVKTKLLPCVEKVFGVVARIAGKLVEWFANSQIVKDLLTAVWDICGFIFDVIGVIADVVEWIFNYVVKPILVILDKIWIFLKEIFKWISTEVMGLINKIKGIFSKVGSWFKNVMHPIVEWFPGIWDYIKKGFYKVLNWLAKPVNALIDAWNWLTGDNVKHITFGADTGKIKPEEDKSISPDKAAKGGGGGGGLSPQATHAASQGATAAVTGGTRNTTVNINLGKMVENIVFNGTLGENAQELENKIQEILTRTLMMAAATA